MEDGVVLVTGAKGGLGTYVTNAFLDAGANVVGVSRSIKQADFPNAKFLAISADLVQASSAHDVVEQVIGRFGRVDVLAHLMGGFASGRIDVTDDAAWEQMRDINLTSAFNVVREVVRRMRMAGYGRIVAVGSQAAEEPHSGLGAYTTFKVAMAAMVKAVALENRDRGITANVVLPGTMDTPANRAAMPNADTSTWVHPQTVADVILALADESTANITGAMLPVLGDKV